MTKAREAVLDRVAPRPGLVAPPGSLDAWFAALHRAGRKVICYVNAGAADAAVGSGGFDIVAASELNECGLDLRAQYGFLQLCKMPDLAAEITLRPVDAFAERPLPAVDVLQRVAVAKAEPARIFIHGLVSPAQAHTSRI